MKKWNFTNICEKIKGNEKKLLKRTIAATAVIAILGGFGVVYAEKKEDQAEQNIYNKICEDAKTDGITLISGEEATKIALEAAKVKEADVRHLEISLEDEKKDHDDDGSDGYCAGEPRYIYEVDFISDEIEYDCEIDAVSKELLHLEYESCWD